MAQKTVIELTDDVDGSKADETVAFGVDGSSYEIDLNTKNASEMRDALAPYVAAARKAGGSSSRRGSSSASSSRAAPKSAGDVDAKAVRTWAEENGIQVSPRGRLSSELLDKYRAAGN